MRPSRLVVVMVMVLALALAGCLRRAGPSAYAAPADPLQARAMAAPVHAAPLPAAAAHADPEGAEPPYLLDSGDRLRVSVFGQEGLTNSYTVDAAGNVNVALIGAVPARGQTTAALSRAIAQRLRQGYVREPHVSVEIETHRPFFILGEVTAPGQYPFVAHMTAQTAVAIAGGYSPRAQKDRVQITRTVNGQTSRLNVPANFPLRPGDTLSVPERWF